jgi:hypothetical protein
MLWRKSWTDIRGDPVSPRKVLRYIENPLYAVHRVAIESATFDQPVLIDPTMTDCYDGLHRMAKAFAMNQSHVRGKVITDAQKQSCLIVCTRPKVVHIVGTGRSELKEQLENDRVNVHCVENFFSDLDVKSSGYDDADDDTKETIRDNYFTQGFEQAMWDAQHKSVVVFIGPLDYASPSGRTYDKQPFDARIFLDVPVSNLLKQYFQYVALKLDDDNYLNSITPPNNTRSIPDSDCVYRWHVETRENHVERGYTLLTATEITRCIEEMCE